MGTAIDKAKTENAGIDLSEVEAVYNNQSSTEAQLTEASAKLVELVMAFQTLTASPEKPADYTPFITNATFDNNNKDGWSGSNPGFQSFGNAEFYWTNYDINQTITGLKNGVYRVAVTGFYRAGWATLLASNLLLTTLIVQPIKHIIHAPRPLTWFAENMPDIALPLVADVKMNHWLSFPSGHTAVSFAAATAIYAINKKWGIAAYIFAVVMGFSRLYLGVHFPLDVLGGAVVGVIAAKLVLYLAKKLQKNH